MKRLIALLLIFLFLTNINCVVTHKYSLNNSGILASCKVAYVEGSVNIDQGEKGVLMLYNELIQFKNKERVLDIPYDKITSMQYDEKLTKVLPRMQDPSFPRYFRKNKYADLKYFIGPVFLLLFYIVASNLYDKLSKKHIYFTINYNINNNDERVTFKIPKDAFDTFYPILRDKTGLKQLRISWYF